MRKTIIGVLALFCALGAHAGTITSLSPSTINVSSGEWFVRINGSGLGDRVTFTGPAGTISLDANQRDAGGVTTWVPLSVVNRAGTYSVVVTGRDGDSNAATFTVWSPKYFQFVLLVPDILVSSIRLREGVYVKYDVATAGGENPSGPVEIVCSPASGSLFKLGSTLVRCTATSSAGERAEAQFPVNIVDDTIPYLKIPDGDIVVEQNQEGGADVLFDAAAYDDIDGDLRVSCDHQSGSVFPVGTTLVTCTATDFSLNPAVGRFNVIVRGKGRLTIRAPERLLVEAANREGGYADYEVTAYGTEDPSPKVKCDPEPGSFVPMGFSTVYCFAEDRFGNVAEAKFEVQVVDSIGPVVSTLVDPQYLVPVDGAMHPVAVKIDPADLVDPAPRCSITDVSANETITLEDWKIVSDGEVYLRAATNDKVNDRIYQIGVQCTDASGNSSTAVANSIVPASGAAPKGGGLSVQQPSSGRRRPSSGK